MGCVVHLWDPTLQVQNLTTANNLQIQTFKLEDTKMQGVLGSGHIILVAICAAFDNSCCDTLYLWFS